MNRDALSERLFVLLWQQKLEELPDDFLFHPCHTTIHQEIMDRMQKHLGQNCRERKLPRDARLPCKRCGVLFRSKRPKYARHCAQCLKSKPYTPRGGKHVTGGIAFGSKGAYEAGRHGPQTWYSAICAHPECVIVFTPSSRLDKCCLLHSRTSAARARDRVAATPKHKRFLFRAPSGSIYETEAERIEGVRIEYSVAGSLRQCHVTTHGYVASDDAELRVLIRFAAADVIEVASLGADGRSGPALPTAEGKQSLDRLELIFEW
jgi:hypothetical protein